MSKKYYELEDIELEFVAAQKYINLKRSAERRGLEFSLKFSDVKKLLKRKTCYYSGVELTVGRSPDEVKELGTDNYCLTIDRINPNLGYVKGNVVPCSHAANQLKSSLEGSSVEEFKMLGKMFNTLKDVGFKGRDLRKENT